MYWTFYILWDSGPSGPIKILWESQQSTWFNLDHRSQSSSVDHRSDVNLVFKTFLVPHPQQGPAADEIEEAPSSLLEFCVCSTQGPVWDLSSGLLCRCIFKAFAFCNRSVPHMHSSCMNPGHQVQILGGTPASSFFSVISSTPSSSMRPPF